METMPLNGKVCLIPALLKLGKPVNQILTVIYLSDFKPEMKKKPQKNRACMRVRAIRKKTRITPRILSVCAWSGSDDWEDWHKEALCRKVDQFCSVARWWNLCTGRELRQLYTARRERRMEVKIDTKFVCRRGISAKGILSMWSLIKCWNGGGGCSHETLLLLF